jgi:hypothetical protein
VPAALAAAVDVLLAVVDDELVHAVNASAPTVTAARIRVEMTARRERRDMVKLLHCVVTASG